MKEFLKRKNIIFSAKRYGIDALGAMAQGLFASLLIGTIISTLGEQLGIEMLVTIGGYAKGATGAAMAISIGYALQAPALVLFSLAAVGMAANELGGAGGPLAVLVVTIFAAEFGKLVSKETKIDIIVTPFVSIAVGVLLSLWWARCCGKCCWWCNYVGYGAAAILYGYFGVCDRGYCPDTADLQCGDLRGSVSDRSGRWCCCGRLLCTDDRLCGYEL